MSSKHPSEVWSCTCHRRTAPKGPMPVFQGQSAQAFLQVWSEELSFNAALPRHFIPNTRLVLLDLKHCYKFWIPHSNDHSHSKCHQQPAHHVTWACPVESPSNGRFPLRASTPDLRHSSCQASGSLGRERGSGATFCWRLWVGESYSEAFKWICGMYKFTDSLNIDVDILYWIFKLYFSVPEFCSSLFNDLLIELSVLFSYWFSDSTGFFFFLICVNRWLTELP